MVAFVYASYPPERTFVFQAPGRARSLLSFSHQTTHAHARTDPAHIRRPISNHRNSYRTRTRTHLNPLPLPLALAVLLQTKTPELMIFQTLSPPIRPQPLTRGRRPATAFARTVAARMRAPTPRLSTACATMAMWWMPPTATPKLAPALRGAPARQPALATTLSREVCVCVYICVCARVRVCALCAGKDECAREFVRACVRACP